VRLSPHLRENAVRKQPNYLEFGIGTAQVQSPTSWFRSSTFQLLSSPLALLPY